MTVHFDHPVFLWLMLAAVPLVAIGWPRLRTLDPLRRVLVIGLRVALVACLAVMLARPRTVRAHDALTVIGLLDVSGSVRRFVELPRVPDRAAVSNLEQLRDWFRRATETRTPDDRFGLIVFDGQSATISVPSRREPADDTVDLKMIEGTNIERAIELALAMFPADTARRLVLVTDGNETAGNALQAVRRAAGGAASGQEIPVDVLPLSYHVKREVQVLRVESPPAARAGQAISVRIIMEATEPTEGLLTLRCEGREVDLNGADPGAARRVTLPAGRSVQLARVVLTDAPVNRFEAIFEPDGDGADALPENNRAEAFTVTPSRGKMLIVDPGGSDDRGHLARVLEKAELPVQVRRASEIPDDLLALQRYDLIIMDNVPAWQLSQAQQMLLSRYVHDLGGGLIMVGGPDSFGVGGWNGSPLEEVLPLEMDPPRQLRMPTAALVLVLDKSGSMNHRVAGARATQQEVANEAAALAIESLRSECLVGVVTFDLSPRITVPLQRLDDPAAVTDRVRSIVADGGTDLAPALRMAHRMLEATDVDKKRIVCLSDGESPTKGLDEIAEAMASDNIRLTTIAVGDDADHVTLERLSKLGGGEFYAVRNPRTLPRVLVDSVQVINEPLLKEVPFEPVVHATGSSLTVGMDEAPTLEGLVVTAPRDDPTVIVEMSHPDGEPLLAHWQSGLGRAAAFTSDARGHWSQQWLRWSGGNAFWIQLARTIARPAVDMDTELTAVIEDDRLRLTLEAGGENGFRDYLLVDGTVYAPDGSALPVRLTQTGPGRYEGSAPALLSGNYIVALSPRQGTRRLAPAIGGASRISGPEFRRLRSNLSLLDQIVEVSRGRRLDVTSPVAVDLFDRRGMPRIVSSLPAWRPVLWAALVILLLDIAGRRIAWNAAATLARFGRALTSIVPASRRGEAAAETLASLRDVSAAVDQRITADRERTRTAAPIEPPPDRPAEVTPEPLRREEPSPRKRRPKRPDAAKVSSALDLLLGRSRPGRAGPDAPPPDETPADEPAEPSEETTSSLLAAKRRARERLSGGNDEDRGQD